MITASLPKPRFAVTRLGATKQINHVKFASFMELRFGYVRSVNDSNNSSDKSLEINAGELEPGAAVPAVGDVDRPPVCGRYLLDDR